MLGDTQADPSERKNLISDPRYAKDLDFLPQELLKHMRKTDDPLLPEKEYSMISPLKNCPDCNVELEPIQMIDSGSGPNPAGYPAGGAMHVQLSYAAPDAKPSWLIGAIKREGVVKGYLCGGCGRILLYGESV